MPCVVVQRLVRHFFNNSINFTLEEKEIRELSLENQEAFLAATVKKELLLKYPISTEFCRLFFKKLINILELHQEIHDELYIYLCDILSNKTQDDFHYKHYIIGDNIQNIITLKETKNLVVNGTTGMRTWQAALMIADFAISNKSEFVEKQVLELGAGVGFTGVTIAKFCDIRSILLTDCHSDVLKTLTTNIEINFPDFVRIEESANTIFKHDNKTIGVTTLDWTSIEDLPNDVIPDVIIGADIIYDPSILKPLCTVVQTFFHRNKNLKVYFANVIRNEDTYRKFLATLDAVGLTWECIPQNDKAFIEWDKTTENVLLNIKLK